MENNYSDVLIKHPKNRAERALNQLNIEFGSGNPYARSRRAWAEYSNKVERLEALINKYR